MSKSNIPEGRQSTIENTKNRDPFVHLLGIMSEGQSGYIEQMESEGQRAIVASELLPTEGDWDAAAAVGIVRGEQDPRDPLFTHATLPAGWHRDPTDHAMHSQILDDRDVPRIGVFYKAAFYDRRADFHLISVGGRISTNILYGDEPVALPEYWGRLTADEKTDAKDSISRALGESAEWIADYGDRDGRYANKIARGKEALRLIGQVTA